jgi:hypothetical protein
MKYISINTNTLSQIWEVELYVKNFIRFGVNPSDIIVVVKGQENEDLLQGFKDLLNDKINVYYYCDTRVSTYYFLSFRPHILAKLFEEEPWLQNEQIFYHDSDIIFSDFPNLETLTKDRTWLSDTNNYINYDYIVQKGNTIADDLATICGISVEDIKSINHKSGGCQYVFDSVTSGFWKKVEHDCELMFNYLNLNRNRFEKEWIELNNDKLVRFNNKLYTLNWIPGCDWKNNTITIDNVLYYEVAYHEIQAHTADMWSVLYNLIFFKKDFELHDKLRFTWATDENKPFYKYLIYHNTGPQSDKEGHFYKRLYNYNKPWDSDLSYVSETSNSNYYIEEMRITGFLK